MFDRIREKLDLVVDKVGEVESAHPFASWGVASRKLNGNVVADRSSDGGEVEN